MEILFRKAISEQSNNFITIRRIKSKDGVKTFISSGTFTDKKSIRSYELSDNEIKDLANIFDKLINCPDFLLSQDSTTELLEKPKCLSDIILVSCDTSKAIYSEP